MPYHILYQEAAGRVTPRRINRLSSLYKELLLRGHFSNLFEPLRPHAWTRLAWWQMETRISLATTPRNDVWTFVWFYESFLFSVGCYSWFLCMIVKENVKISKHFQKSDKMKKHFEFSVLWKLFVKYLMKIIFEIKQANFSWNINILFS